MIQTVLFFTMCLMMGVEDDRYSDCSFSWYLIEDKDIFNTFYEVFRADSPHNVNQVSGFINAEYKVIFVRNLLYDNAILKHEALHAKCILNKEIDNNFDSDSCHWDIDKPNETRGSIMPQYGFVNAIPNPEYSNKMGFALFLKPPFVTQAYYDELKEVNWRK